MMTGTKMLVETEDPFKRISGTELRHLLDDQLLCKVGRYDGGAIGCTRPKRARFVFGYYSIFFSNFGIHLHKRLMPYAVAPERLR